MDTEPAGDLPIFAAIFAALWPKVVGARGVATVDSGAREAPGRYCYYVFFVVWQI